MHYVRAIMSRLYYYAEGHGLWEKGRTCRIQARLAKAAKEVGKQKKAAKKVAPAPTTPPAPAPAAPGTPEMPLATRLIQ